MRSIADETDSRSKPSDSNNQKKDLLEIMKELQPVAFLISMCLVIAAFYVNPANEVSKNNLIHILMASLSFFFAYLGLFCYKKNDFPLFRYFGECSLIGGVWFVYNAFAGIIGIIDKEVNPVNSFFISVFLISLSLITTMFLSGKVKKGKMYNFSKVLFHFSLVLLFSYIVLYSSSYLVYFILKLQKEFYVPILLSGTVIIRDLLIVISSVSLFLMMVLYELESIYPWIDGLSIRFKDADTFDMNIIKSLGIIVNTLGRITYLIISFCLIIIGFWLLVSV
ncbi:hypothetical protein RSJ42_05895 [Methanosarcina hadiensis]|uniref:hypothetical protein n=1 Tax=Methanosarcina hadiensis TaxID=3078083 RepID=UPI0039773870